MLLHAIDAGTGPSTVLLLHGMMGSSDSWWRLIPSLTANGHRVIALDLPGHGLSERDPQLTIEQAAASVIETVRHLGPGRPLAAVGHSYGATVLAAAAKMLQPDLSVYVDAALALTGGHDRGALTAQYARDRGARLTPEDLLASRPFYSVQDAEVEARAAALFDPATTASISCDTDHSWLPDAGSIVVKAEPSSWVSDDDARRFAANGADVRSIAGAAHTIWYSHFDEFTASLPELFGPPAARTLP